MKTPTVLALMALATGCVVGDKSPGADDESVTTRYDDAQATSVRLGDQILTELVGLDGATPLATATWSADGSGEVTIEGERIAVTAPDPTDLTPSDANEVTHQMWMTSQQEIDTAYDDCYQWSDPNSCCSYSICCYWVPGTYPSYGYRRCEFRSNCPSWPGYNCV